jgi:ABC-2 type transport system permease protein
VPLTFFPDWLETIAQALPFQGIVYIPAAIYLGRVQGEEALRLVSLQLAWVLVLWVAGRLLWRRGIRQVTVHGG